MTPIGDSEEALHALKNISNSMITLNPMLSFVEENNHLSNSRSRNGVSKQKLFNITYVETTNSSMIVVWDILTDPVEYSWAVSVSVRPSLMNVIGQWITVYEGSGSGCDIQNLTSDTTYHVRVKMNHDRGGIHVEPNKSSLIYFIATTK
jgi:hypothetical protein